MSNPNFNLLQGDPTTWGTPPTGRTYLGINDSGQAVLVNNVSGSPVITVIGSAVNVAAEVELTASSSATTTVTPTAAVQTAQITISGSVPATVQIALSTAGVVPGQRLIMPLLFPAVAGLDIKVYNGTTSSTLLSDYTTNETDLEGRVDFYVDQAGAWVRDGYQFPL